MSRVTKDDDQVRQVIIPSVCGHYTCRQGVQLTL